MAIIYTNIRSPRKKSSSKIKKANEEHKEWLKTVGYVKPTNIKRTWTMPEPFVSKSKPEMSNTIGNGFKRSVDDYKWKKDRTESAETIKEIERKKARIAPAYNKGAVQYLTDGTDPATIGRKI